MVVLLVWIVRFALFVVTLCWADGGVFLVVVVFVCDLVLARCLCCWLAFNADVYLSLL